MYENKELYPLYEEYLYSHYNTLLYKNIIKDLRVTNITINSNIKNCLTINYNYSEGKYNYNIATLLTIRKFEIFLRNKKINKLKDMIKNHVD